MNRRSILTATLAAATAAIVSVSAVTAATDRPAHPNDNRTVAAYVRAEHLNVTGLSPASIRPLPQSSTGDRAAIIRFAIDNGLTGLSPASMHPAGD